MIVYVITQGEYSDYGICAVALDKNKAEELRKRYSDRFDEAHIETYDTDDYYPEKGKFFRVEMGVRSYIKVREIGPVCVDMRNTIYTDTDRQTKRKYYFVYVKTTDEEHAKKIATDLLAKYKAEKQGL